jgi:hypothetical protein
MSAVNDALRAALPVLRISFSEDDVILNNAGTQAVAYPVRGGCVRVTKSTVVNLPNNPPSAMILRQGDAGTASRFTFVFNDSANAIIVFSAVGEKHGGVTNGSLSIPAGQCGFFFRVPRTDPTFGQDWRGTLIS